MLEISRKWGMLALALATGAALVAGSVALRPTQALADDGGEAAAAKHADRGRGAFDDVLDCECVSITGSHERHECSTLTKETAMPIKGGWWLLEAGNTLMNRDIVVTGDANFVCSGAVDLGFGCIHVAKGAVLTLFCEAGVEDCTSLTSMNNRGTIENAGTVIRCNFPINGEGVTDVIMCAGEDDESRAVRTTGARDLAAEGTTLAAGTYVLSADKTYNDRLSIAGDVTIVLREGVTLNCLKGIHVPNDKTFTVYSEVGGTSTLIADASSFEGRAGIGGDRSGDNGGNVNIYGAHVVAKGGKCAAGIGSGNSDSGDGGYAAGNVTICNATVEAVGQYDAAGIGGCHDGDGGTVVIRRSRVIAKGGDAGATGIGAGSSGNGGSVEIVASAVEVTGGKHAAGIGGGRAGVTTDGGNGGKVKIVDSNVKATGNGRGAGIGGGGDDEGTPLVGAGNGGDVTITGDSVVEAISGCGAAIGRGEGADGVGEVHLSENLHVVDFDNNGVIAPFGLRGEYCKYRNHVKVEPGTSAK